MCGWEWFLIAGLGGMVIGMVIAMVVGAGIVKALITPYKRYQ